jgi:hypothetical protein
VIGWRERYNAQGPDGLMDAPRSGRPKVVGDAALIAATLEPPPEHFGVAHWSSRMLARHLGIGDATVARAWRRYGVQPWQRATFKFSTDPQLVAKVQDVVGLYLGPAGEAVVLCLDEGVHALDRPAPVLPRRPGHQEKAPNDYARPGTASLFAALEAATGKATDTRYSRHAFDEFVAFLKKVAQAYPRRELHVVVAGSSSSYKHPDLDAWLAKHPRTTLHSTPALGSWLNLVEVFFGIISRQAVQRGASRSGPDVVAAIRRFIDGWDGRCHPFVWPNTATEILPRASYQTSHAGLTVELLTGFFRSLKQWRSLFESEGQDTLSGPDGERWDLFEFEELYDWSQRTLPEEERRAIQLCLFRDLPEAEAASIMQLQESSLVLTYASKGLEKVVEQFNNGKNETGASSNAY